MFLPCLDFCQVSSPTSQPMTSAWYTTDFVVMLSCLVPTGLLNHSEIHSLVSLLPWFRARSHFSKAHLVTHNSYTMNRTCQTRGFKQWELEDFISRSHPFSLPFLILLEKEEQLRGVSFLIKSHHQSSVIGDGSKSFQGADGHQPSFLTAQGLY